MTSVSVRGASLRIIHLFHPYLPHPSLLIPLIIGTYRHRDDGSVAADVHREVAQCAACGGGVRAAEVRRGVRRAAAAAQLRLVGALAVGCLGYGAAAGRQRAHVLQLRRSSRISSTLLYNQNRE